MKKQTKEKVIIAISGGVDSSVSAKLLIDQGYDVTGIFLHFWKEPNQTNENKCCSLSSLMDARMVCNKLGIKLYTLNYSKEFKKEVVDNFLEEYKNGKTPNPCVVCNEKVKLGMLIKHAKKLGFNYVASGHYAQIKKQGNEYKIYKGVDEKKDQSYFLHRLSQEQLSHLLFPIGNLKKTEVRKIAEQADLCVAKKSDSQEICFVGTKSHNDFLKKHLKLKAGEIRTIDDKVIGEHKGLPLYTPGQRKGIEIGGIGPFYAIKMDYKNNILYVSNNKDDKLLYNTSFYLKKINWNGIKKPTLPLDCETIIRYGHQGTKCKITKEGDNYKVKLNEPLRAITIGQSAVFYNNDQLLGGGVINTIKL